MNKRLADIKRRARLRKKRRADRRGVALIMVLGAITVLTVFLTELQEQTSAELSAAFAERDAVKAEYYARSAINLSRLLIAMEPQIRTGIPFLSMIAPGLKQIPVWKYQDMVLGSFNDSASTQSFSSLINADPATGKNLGLTGGHFELTIVDEDSKINLNTAALNLPTSRDILGSQLIGLMASPEYNPLFEGRDADNQFSDRQAICGALIDWADSDINGNEQLYGCDPNSNNIATTGSEDNFYQTIGLNYRRKNAAFDSLEELRLVRGISDDFWSTFVDPDPSNPDKRNITVWGQGKINMLTANAQTLLAVICADKGAQATFCADLTQVGPFLQMVSMAHAIMPGFPIFGTPQELVKFLQSGGTDAGKGGVMAFMGPLLSSMTGTTLKPVVFTNANTNIVRQLGNTSKIFSIYADGIVPGYRKTTKIRIHAVVDFRLAQGIGEAFGVIPGAPTNPATTGTAAGATPPPTTNNASGGSIPPAAYDALLRSNPAGTVIYWRVE